MALVKIKKHSFYRILSWIMFFSVGGVIAMQSTYDYMDAKDRIYAQMKTDSLNSIKTIDKNIAKYITSYSISDYQDIMISELSRYESGVIVVEDYKMGQIIGKKAYITGKIKNHNGVMSDYDLNAEKDVKKVSNCFYSLSKEIIDKNKKVIGKLSIYLSSYDAKKELEKVLYSTIIKTILSVSALIFILMLTIRYFILRPLSQIVTVIENSDADGMPLESIPYGGSSEIFTLSRKIDNMIYAIKSSKDKLSKQQVILHKQAKYDLLTGLPNRTMFSENLEQAIANSRRNNDILALFFIDLDHFKEINDSLGHDAGDKVLNLVASKFKDALRDKDIISRLGGDEFTVIIEGLKEAHDASLLADKLLKSLREPIYVNSNKLYISSSIGISLYPNDGATANELLKYSDAAMYKSKTEGRNNYQYYSVEMTELAFERVMLETSLREALENDDFVVYYQPQIDAKRKKLIGMEALVRWNHKSMGIVSPSKFISLAETTGILMDIDRIVIKKAMLQTVDWQKRGLFLGKMSINISTKQLTKKNFIDIVVKLLEETKCKVEWIEFEITESHIMIDIENSIKMLEKLDEIGISLAVDDFGTGYSSLAYLKQLPISKLKIDQAFVGDLPDDEEDVAITQAIIALAKSLKLSVIAEGVETKEQKEFLISNGCFNMQGYLFSMPLSSDEMENFLMQNRLNQEKV